MIALIVCIVAISGFHVHKDINDKWAELNREMRYDLPFVIDKMLPSVVMIKSLDGWFASGVIIGKHTVLTAKHVIENIDSKIVVVDVNNNEYIADSNTTDPNNDCGLLHFKEEFKCISEFVDFNNVHVGDRIFTIGSQLGYFNIVTSGIVSALKCDDLDFSNEYVIIIDADCNYGSSGGPVFDKNGQIVGIVVGGTNSFTIVISAAICKKLYDKETSTS